MADAALDAEAKEKLAEQMQKVQDGIEASNGTIRSTPLLGPYGSHMPWDLWRPSRGGG